MGRQPDTEAPHTLCGTASHSKNNRLSSPLLMDIDCVRRPIQCILTTVRVQIYMAAISMFTRMLNLQFMRIVLLIRLCNVSSLFQMLQSINEEQMY